MKRILNWFNLYDEDYSFFDSIFFFIVIIWMFEYFFKWRIIIKVYGFSRFCYSSISKEGRKCMSDIRGF